MPCFSHILALRKILGFLWGWWNAGTGCPERVPHPWKHSRPETTEVTEPFPKNPLHPLHRMCAGSLKRNKTNHCSYSQVENTGTTIPIDPLMRKGIYCSHDFFKQINKKAITWTSVAHWAHSPQENNIPTEQGRFSSTSYQEFTSGLHSGAETCISWFKGLLPFHACFLKMALTLHRPTAILLLKASDSWNHPKKPPIILLSISRLLS